jgi:Flp pilus assembly protein TadD
MGLTSADLYYTHGVILEQRNGFDAAVAMYSKAGELDPSNADYLVAQAESLVAADRADEALRLLESSAGRVDDDGTVSMLAAHIAGLLGEKHKASKRYADAFAVQPKDPLVAEELGRHLAREGRCDQAVAVLRPLVESPPNIEAVRSAAARTLAACYLTLGDAAAAKDTLIEYERDYPDDALAQLLLAKAAVATNDLPTALRAIDLARRREPDRPELWFVRAVIRWRRGNLTGAASDLHDVLTNNPDDVEAHCLLAEVLRGQSRIDAARNHFQYALSLDPDCTWAAAGLKALHSMNGEDPAGAEPTPQFTQAIVPSESKSHAQADTSPDD